ncbi:pectate lyase [Prevotellaceae bacterium LKV-178-WT-2A]|uniref:Pectate lyase n=2 Tax=Hallella mizrahii TaxID=2606637 RepID=A0A7K0KIS9_9BACT|nr:pectate lyase [Hallella mizrahii]
MKKNILKTLLTLFALLLFPGWAWADASWNFTSTPSTDVSALKADVAGWTYETKNNRYANKLAVADAQLAANGQTLTMTAGLYFTSTTAGNIRVDVNKRLGLNGSDIVVRIPNLTAGATVKVNFGPSSKGKDRSLKLTNLSETAFSSSSNTGADCSATVTADGDVTLTTTGGVYLFSISVTEKGGTSTGTKADVSDHAVAFDSQANQALVTNSNSSLKYYNTADITKIAVDKDTLYVRGTDWQDVYYTPKNVSFAKASGNSTGGKISNEDGKVEITEAKGWLESAYVKFKKLGDCTLYHVYIKGGDFASYTRIDSMLVRSYGDTYRADMVGLKAGNYDMKVVPVSKGKELETNANEATAMTVLNYDRSGFAHLDNAGVGAYNDDGSLKSDARVIYVTAQTAKTVTCEVKTGSKATNVTTFTGLQSILDAYQKGYETRPLDVRFIGLVEKADLDAVSSSSEGLQIKGKKAYSNLFITLEGIGDDATLRGFGLLLRNAANVELRNFAIMRCMDDCVSIDTDNKFIWVHHLDFFYGQKGSDADQVKGDGTTDIKGDSQYITVAYNHYFDSGKSSLCGMTSESEPNYIDYHHNWFDHSDSRHPRVRTMSVHVWNNYYDGCAKYGVGATSGSSVFVESNYFRATKDPMLISQQGTDAKGGGTFSGETGGMIKSYGNVYADKGLSSNFTPITQHESAASFDCYEVASRDEQVPGSVKALVGGTAYDNFDTNSTLMYTYKPAAATQVPAEVTGWTGAGRLGKGDFKWTFSASDDSSYTINAALSTAIDSYQSKMVGISAE